MFIFWMMNAGFPLCSSQCAGSRSEQSLPTCLGSFHLRGHSWCCWPWSSHTGNSQPWCPSVEVIKWRIKEKQQGEQEQLSSSSVCNGRCWALETRQAQSSTERVISRAQSTSGTHISQARFGRVMLTKNVGGNCNNFFFHKSIFLLYFLSNKLGNLETFKSQYWMYT